jgi:hypothetical protein
MIYLETGANNVDVTVTEKVTISSPEFVFVFVNDNTGKKVACTQTNSSSNTNEYDRFVITVGVNTPLLGKVLLDDFGFYHYYIYQTADASAFDYSNIDTTDLRTLTGLVEEGKAYWQGTSNTINSYKDIRTSVKTYGE